MKEIIKLFVTFFKVGIMTFGGGIAMLPILEREIVEKKMWATREELMDYYAVSQCTPGIIAVNVATFIGHKLKGIKGGISATIGVVTPSYLIITVLALFLKSFSDILWVKSAFQGIRVAVCALVVGTVIKLIKDNVKNMWGIILSLVSFASVFFFSLSPVIIVVVAIIMGIALNKAKEVK